MVNYNRILWCLVVAPGFRDQILTSKPDCLSRPLLEPNHCKRCMLSRIGSQLVSCT
uniref:Uncharacterized protein n=1 Tax=Anguilla anguilla TaxID=7936 RepID=A0A0E9SY84_ANGAN